MNTNVMIGLIIVAAFVFGYAIGYARNGFKTNIGTLWIDTLDPEINPNLYLELKEGVGYFMEDKQVCMDVRIVQNTAPARE